MRLRQPIPVSKAASSIREWIAAGRDLLPVATSARRRDQRASRWSRALPSWLVVIAVLAIVLSSAAGIETINRRQSRAAKAELVVTQIRVVAMKATIVFDKYLIDPSQALPLAREFVALQDEAQSLVDQLGSLAPGPEQQALAESLTNLKYAAGGAITLAQRNQGQGEAGRDYIETVLQPLGGAFLSDLEVAQESYHAEAAQQQHRARMSMIGLLIATLLFLIALLAVNERLRRANLAIVERQERRFRSLVQHGTDLISLLDDHGIVRYQSPSIARTLGFEPATVEGWPISALIHPEDAERLDQTLQLSRSDPASIATGEVRMSHADGGWRTVDFVMSNRLGDPDVGGFVLTSRDVTVRKELMQQIAHSAMHDSLTGLPNRRLLLDRLTQALARANRSVEKVALLFIDLDDFKIVNDTMGHDAGDELLTLVSRRILQSVRPGDTLARLGGDEFVVLLDTIEPHTALRIAERVSDSITAPFEIAGTPVRVAVSIGVSEQESPLDEPEDLLRRADLAMYASKRTGTGRPAVYTESIESERQSRSFAEEPLLLKA